MSYDARDVRDVLVVVMLTAFALGLLTGWLGAKATTPGAVHVTVEQLK